MSRRGRGQRPAAGELRGRCGDALPVLGWWNGCRASAVARTCISEVVSLLQRSPRVQTVRWPDCSTPELLPGVLLLLLSSRDVASQRLSLCFGKAVSWAAAVAVFGLFLFLGSLSPRSDLQECCTLSWPQLWLQAPATEHVLARQRGSFWGVCGCPVGAGSEWRAGSCGLLCRAALPSGRISFLGIPAAVS